jgi:glyoxylase-like metal-dependent hydrolase (beta-lactamase superfamily II)
MAPVVSELIEIAPSLLLWHTYDPAVKADLFSTAFALRNRIAIVIVDPIRLESGQLAELQKRGCIGGIVVTNANHHRAATWYSEQFSAPILARAEAFPEGRPDRFTEVRDASAIDDELDTIQIDGAAAGELALYHAANGTLIVGDALINFEPYGFTLLPRKYCRNEKEMRRSLRRLLDCEVQRIFFAHGLPILVDAQTRLRQLLESNV